MAAYASSIDNGDLPAFNAESLGYQILVASAEGRVDRLKGLIDPLNADSVRAAGNLHCYKEGSKAYRSPLHCALKKSQWSAAAFLLNSGVSWKIKSIKKSGVSGTSPIERFNLIEEGLVCLLRSMLEFENINFRPIAHLLISKKLSNTRRFEVVKDCKTRKAFCQKIKPDEALYMMASLLIGSHRWKGSFTDLNYFYTTADLSNFMGAGTTMNCNGLLTYASYLTGMHSMKDIVNRIFEGVNKTSIKAIFESSFRVVTERELVYLLNQQYAKNLGLVREEERKLDLTKKVDDFVVRVFYCVDDVGYVDHYGLITFFPGKKPFAIHISQDSKVVVAKAAEKVIKESKNWKHIYLSMLPWHVSDSSCGSSVI